PSKPTPEKTCVRDGWPPCAAERTTPPAHYSERRAATGAALSAAPSGTSGLHRSACKQASAAKFANRNARSTSGPLFLPRKDTSPQCAEPTPVFGRKLLVRGTVSGQFRRDLSWTNVCRAGCEFKMEEPLTRHAVTVHFRRRELPALGGFDCLLGKILAA